MTQNERVLALLRSRGSQGLAAVELQPPHIVDGGTPVLRVAARIDVLKRRGYSITSQRLGNGTARYVLVGEPETVQRTPSEAKSASSGEQAGPALVASQEAVRPVASAEPSLFDTAGYQVAA